MIKLRLYFKEYMKESILGPLFKLLEATLELFVPIVIA
ncbi:MAG TPA: ABC transporter ATP-binding protein, partial [Thermoclostridium sp.]|nr:ABC transporter ATP-binding protein [Thermoclostridium sp.]